MDTILFDWDGTLIDTLEHLYLAHVAVMEHFGLPADRERFRRQFVPDWRLTYKRAGIPADRVEEAGRLWTRAFRGYEADLFPGTREALALLAGAGYRLGLVTAGHREHVEPQLRRHDLEELLEVRVFGDDEVPGKPDPAPLLLALAGLERADRPASSAYLGDALDDMRMAAAVGARAVGIRSFLATPAELRAAGADEVADSVVEWATGVLAASPAVPGRRGRAVAPGREAV